MLPLLPQIFHYAKGQPYIDEVGTFKERIQWVGDPQWKDGSIVIHNLDYSDNGTFTCDVKNPPDIVGKTSQVTLYVFEKGVRGGGMGVWEAVQRRDQASMRGWGKGQNAWLMPFRLWDSGQKAAFVGKSSSPNFRASYQRYLSLLITPLLFLPLLVPTRYGVVLGAVIGGVLGVVLLGLLLFYLIRYCWLRRQAALQRRLR